MLLVKVSLLDLHLEVDFKGVVEVAGVEIMTFLQLDFVYSLWHAKFH